MKSSFWKLTIATALLSVVSASGQEAAHLEQTSAPESQSASSSVAASQEGPLARWLTLDHLDFSSRYRNSFGTNGFHMFNSGQQRSLVSGKFKLDKAGNYFVGFRASSGRYFNWAYSNFAGQSFGAANAAGAVSPGTASLILPALGRGAVLSVPEGRGWNFYMRELYFSASPTSYLTFEFGGLGIDRGVASEITTYDEDGYVTGERIRIKDKKHLYFDQVSATFAYFGGSNAHTPNFFARGSDLGKNNYRQVMVQKAFGKRVSMSAEYDWYARFNTLREAAKVNVAESKIFDSARIELYQRLNAAPLEFATFGAANGWSAAAAKTLHRKQWQLEGGYANVDRYYGVYSGNQISAAVGFSLNGDSYQVGQRVFTRVSYTPHPFVTLFGFVTREVNQPQDLTYNSFNKQNVQGGLTVNFKAMLDRAGLL